MILADGTLITPFGIPFDTAVLAGLLLSLLAIVLAGRVDRRSAQRAERTKTTEEDAR
ncbi:hypothetical protein EV191_11163 [Tamaricihabitans halophyticus]|uniref:Uncharacterized protein n=1 Tax=Tamaricihabitans halophyticus TaxID=1262583 RepID=A0A4R2QHM0_9PSEU|nr:hypothetical protein [Tamaricihabitans halophyticus]TCP47858.1 hypothetical protein EV191_11163 [Tamaricihabitans halophyticus]